MPTLARIADLSGVKVRTLRSLIDRGATDPALKALFAGCLVRAGRGAGRGRGKSRDLSPLEAFGLVLAARLHAAELRPSCVARCLARLGCAAEGGGPTPLERAHGHEGRS